MRITTRVKNGLTVTLSSEMVRWGRPSIRGYVAYVDKRLDLVDWDNEPLDIYSLASFPLPKYNRVSPDWSKL